jgi:RNA polymerase sigma-70 factor, ECF subfamily
VDRRIRTNTRDENGQPADAHEFEEPELVRNAVAGDSGAREEIVRRYQMMVYNLAIRLTRDPDEAAVVLQETFMKVFRALPRFRSGSRLTTWIYRIATNEALQRLRARRDHTFVDLDQIDAEASRDLTTMAQSLEGDPHQLLENRELRARLEGAIGELPPKHRTAFVLVDIEGLSLKDAAASVGVSLAAMKTDLHRARLFLRDRLADYLGGHVDGR